MGRKRLVLCSIVFLATGFAQTDRGTLTGTVSDPAGAVVPRADIVVTSVETGAVYKAATTDTGNYTVSELPAGAYELTVSAQGFTRYVQQGIRVQVAQIGRIDVKLQLGSTSESVTVTSDVALLKTESSDQSTNLAMSRVNDLPLYGSRGAEAGLRTPYAFISVVPGATLAPANTTTSNNSTRVNGLPNDSFGVRIEGQESTYTQQPSFSVAIQPGVDALQEVSLQTSNFSPEYGQVSGGLINFTAKSGSNEFHGSAIEYFRNEDFNAGQPFTSSGNGHLLRPTNRSHDFGGGVGGPVRIPHLYNGRNRTFFYFNYEESYQKQINAGTYGTVPTDAERGGNFSALLTGKTLATDPLGRSIVENAIYDPATARLVNGQSVTDQFPGNIIPVSRMDPVALKIQALIPAASRSGLVNNWAEAWPGKATNTVITLKIDHNISDKSKLSYYFSDRLNLSTASNGDALPIPLTSTRRGTINSPTQRLNYDRTITPTLLVHIGVGFIRHMQGDAALAGDLTYDAPGKLGFVGGVVNNFAGAAGTGFPKLLGMYNSYGGFTANGFSTAGTIGPVNSNNYYMEKPTAVASVTWVRGNHTYKAGGEWRKDAQTDRNVRGAQGILTFSNIETALPSTNGQNLSGGAVGFPYASFLLGAVNSAAVATPQDPQFRKIAWGLYIQGTWKITRKVTLDYGFRWDYQTALSELHDRFASFSPTVANPSVGGLLGGMAYAGNGAGRINGQFAKTYPYGIGPRLGIAWQFLPNTVLRAGWGLVYGATPNYGYISNTPIVGVGFNELFWNPPSFGTPAVTLAGGLPYTRDQLFATSLNPGILPPTGTVASPPYWIDPEGGRPGRVNQWTIGIQRSITTNLAAEVAYVANRGVWLTSTNLNDLNGLTPQRLASLGLNISNASDRSLLTSTFLSGVPQSRGFKLPYTGFPIGQTLAQSLRPYPQFLNIPVLWTPRGNSWYDAVQAKLTRRFSHGFDVTVAFTFQREFILGPNAVAVNDVYNRGNQKSISPSSIPVILAPTFTYQPPLASLVPGKWMKAIVGGWAIAGVLRFQSGMPILVPYAQNSLNAVLLRTQNPATFSNRVAGQPLFNKDVNCHCFDPNTTFVLNPKAWSDPATGQWGTSAAYYNDYRGQRRYTEMLSLGRYFRVHEGMRLEVRAMFYNVFNRTYLNDPDSTNALATQVLSSAGQVVSGFGRINTGSTYLGPRTGLVLARFQF